MDWHLKEKTAWKGWQHLSLLATMGIIHFLALSFVLVLLASSWLQVSAKADHFIACKNFRASPNKA
jgi:hypothetical protein